MAQTNRFEGKAVLITGAARGQGRTHAVGFAREGADVAICDVGGGDVASAPYALGSADELSETARLVHAEGRRAVVGRFDVRDYSAMSEFVQRALAEFGKIDILVTNAGILSFGAMVDLTDEQWNDIFDINVKGVWHAVKAVVPQMQERGYGRVVIAGSVGSLIGFPGIGHYTATKHALNGITKSLALELAPRGITVNLVCPSTVKTPMIQNDAAYALMSPDDPSESAAARIHEMHNAMGVPWYEPEEVTKLVLFVASDDARYMTGVAIPLDMGFTAG